MSDIKVKFLKDGVFIIDPKAKEGLFKFQFHELDSKYFFAVESGLAEASRYNSLVNFKNYSGETRIVTLFVEKDFYRFNYDKDNGLFVRLWDKKESVNEASKGFRLDDSLIQDFLKFFDAGASHIFNMKYSGGKQLCELQKAANQLWSMIIDRKMGNYEKQTS